MKTYLNSVWTLSLLTSLAVLPSATAADRTWNGGGGDDFWSTPANWGGSAVSANDSLRFGGSVRTSPNNDFPPGTVFNGITFLNPAGAFTLRGNSIGLAGNISDDQPLVPQTIQFPIALTLPPTINVAADGSLTLSGIVSGSGAGITKTGAGQLTLGAANTFDGQVQILGGTVAASTDANLGAAPGSATARAIVIDNGALRGTASFTLNANRGIAVGPTVGNGDGAIRVNSGATLSYAGVIANNGGSGGLTKQAFGGLTLSGANTYTGPTVIENGTLTLDFTQAGSPVNDVISSSSPLTLGGGTAGLGAASFDALTMNGKASVANSQSFNGTTITLGPAIIRANSGAGGTANINLGALSSTPGGILNVIPPTQTGGAGAISTTTANTHGILGGWATIGNGTVYRNITMGTEWATVDGTGNLVPYTGYTIFNTGENLHTIGDASKNIRIDATSSGDAVVNTPDAATLTDVNTINLAATRMFSVVIGNGNTLRLGRYGSIFKSDFASGITWALGSGTAGGGNGVQDSGTLTAGGAADTDGTIVFYMNNNASQSSGSLNVECKITDNGSGRVSVVKMGPSSMKLRGHNTYSGGLYVLQGRLQLAGGEIGTANPDGPGTGPVHVYPGAYLFPSGTGSILTNEFFISGLGTDQEQVGAVRFGNGWSISGNVNLTGDTRLGGGNAATLPTTGISGKISGPYSLDIGALGTINSFITLSNPDNDWTGNTTINARNTGTANSFRNGASEVLPHGPGKGNVTMNGNTSTGTITWDLNGFNETVNGLLSAGNLAGCIILNNLSTTASTLTVGDYDQTATFGGVIQNGAAGLGVVNLTKIGGGRQTLTGANTYTGITTVNGGVLALTGAGSIGSSVNIVVNGGTLDVSEVPGGFAYGSSIDITSGSLAIRNTTSTGISALNMTDSRVRVAGLGSAPVVADVAALTTGGAANYVDIASMGTISSYPATFTIIKYAGAIGGTGFNFLLGSVLTPSTVGYVTNNEANSSVDLVLLDGPKPLTWTGLLGPAWDIDTTPNWLAFGITPSVYLDVDSVRFEDTGATGTVDLTTTLQPGAVVVNNDALTYTFTGAGRISGPASLTKDGPGTLILANSGTNNFFGPSTINAGTVQVGNGGTVGDLSAGSVVNNGRLLFNRSDDITVANPIAGGDLGLLEQTGPGILTLAGDNSFTGAVLVAQSTLKPARANALGSSAGITTVSPGATLDVNGQNVTTEPVTVSGSGVGGNGAIVNSGGDQTSALRDVTLTGDVVFGGTQRWDIRNTGGDARLFSAGAPHKITKVGANAVSIVNAAVDVALGDVDVTQGILRVEGTTTGLGDIFNSLIVRSGATFALFNLNPNALNKVISLEDGATVMHESGRSLVDGPITLNGTNTFNTSNSGGGGGLTLNGPLDGAGALLKLGAGPLVIATGSATYSGPTLVNLGTLIVDGSIATSPITVAGGTLAGAGAIISPVLITPTGRLAPGNLAAAIGALNIDTELTLRGTTVMEVSKLSGTIVNDEVRGFSTLSYGGTLQLTLTGDPLANGDEIQLFSFGLVSGAFDSIVPATPGAGLQWDTSGLTVDGRLKVVSPQAFEFGSVTIAYPDMIFQGAGGPPNAEFRVLTSTDVGLPVINWDVLATKQFDANGNFNFTLPVDAVTPQRYYILAY